MSIAAPALCAKSLFQRCIFGLVAVLALGCASHQTVAADRCGLRSADSVFAAAGTVFRDCAVDQPVRLANNAVRPDWTPPQPVRTACYFVELEFVVDTAGRPEVGTARAVRSNEPAFADAWLATLNQWKYEPAHRGGVKVRQIVTEKRSAQTGTVIVPKGSPPPSRPPVSRPAC